MGAMVLSLQAPRVGKNGGGMWECMLGGFKYRLEKRCGVS